MFCDPVYSRRQIWRAPNLKFIIEQLMKWVEKTGKSMYKFDNNKKNLRYF